MDSGSSDTEEVSLEYKIAILGNGAVGKTSLIRKACNDNFTPAYAQTLGLDFYSFIIQLPQQQQQQQQQHGLITLRLWDVGGQQLGGTMLTNYIKDADAICFIYDVTSVNSLKDVEDWHASVIASLTENERIPLMILVGNKTDLPNREVSQATHMQAADKLKMDEMCVSARSGDKVRALFTKIAARLNGVNITQEELQMIDRVVANIESTPEERQAVFEAMEIKGNDKRNGDKNCTVM